MYWGKADGADDPSVYTAYVCVGGGTESADTGAAISGDESVSSVSIAGYVVVRISGVCCSGTVV